MRYFVPLLAAAILLVVPSAASASYFYNHRLAHTETHQLGYNHVWAGLSCGQEFYLGPDQQADVRGQQWYRWSIRTVFNLNHYHGYIADEYFDPSWQRGQVVWDGLNDAWQGGLNEEHPVIIAQSYRNVDGTPWVRFTNYGGPYTVQFRKRCI